MLYEESSTVISYTTIGYLMLILLLLHSISANLQGLLVRIDKQAQSTRGCWELLTRFYAHDPIFNRDNYCICLTDTRSLNCLCRKVYLTC